MRRTAIAVLAAAVAGLAAATVLVWDGGEAVPAPVAPAPGAVLDGEALFAAKGCAVCHFGPGRTDGFGIGPDLRGLAGAAPEYVRESILAPSASVVPGFGAMPDVAVSPAEADALVAYLLDLSAPTS